MFLLTTHTFSPHFSLISNANQGKLFDRGKYHVEIFEYLHNARYLENSQIHFEWIECESNLYTKQTQDFRTI